MKTERLEAQSRRDNLRFYGVHDKSDYKSDESWEELETRVQNYIDERLNIDEVSIPIKGHIVSGVKNLHDPL